MQTNNILIKKHYEAEYAHSNYSAGITKGSLFSFAIDSKETAVCIGKVNCHLLTPEYHSFRMDDASSSCHGFISYTIEVYYHA